MTAKGSVHTDARSGPERDDRGRSSWGPVQILLDKGAGSANKVEHADVPMTLSRLRRDGRCREFQGESISGTDKLVSILEPNNATSTQGDAFKLDCDLTCRSEPYVHVKCENDHVCAP